MKTLFSLSFACVLMLSACLPGPLFGQGPANGSYGHYRNPILGGDYPDPTIMRDGEDYYMTHSAFDYVPGLVVFHSRDLVHWEPISAALNTFIGSVWAPDICKYKDKYYIYFTVAFPSDAVRAKAGRKLTPSSRMNFVVTADSPYGPWSEPKDLGVANIDPCHVVGEDGQRWLFMSGGKRVRLTDDGLSTVPGTEEVIYRGWQYPDDWLTEGLCLEGPKLRKIGDYYYYLNAEGGTAGPPTSHMVVVARSKSIDGPWENSPYNPLIHTYRNSDRWWSKGHGSLIDTPDGRWLCVYHSYENLYTDLGRQTLMEPVMMTDDGWFRPVITDSEGLSADPDGPIDAPLPTDMTVPADRKAKLGEFRLGLDWKFYRNNEPERITHVTDGITLQAKGTQPGNASPLMFVAGDRRYEVEVEVTLNDAEASAGLVLYYDSAFYMGIGTTADRRLRFRKGGTGNGSMHPQPDTRHIWLRLRNDNHVVTGQYSYDGTHWMRETWGMDCSGYNHNTLYQFQSVLPGVYCSGKGSATLTHLTYRNLDKEEVKEAMLRATRYMMDSVSNEGGFVWEYLADGSRRWGELEAPYRSMVWIQPPGTPTMGHMMMDAYNMTGDDYYYEQALKICRLLARVQHPEGGWNYVEDLNGADELKTFYSTVGRQAWRLEEFQHYYGNCTFDDGATSACATLLLRTYMVKHDADVKAALDKVVAFVLKSQYSNGGWPQRYPLMYDHVFEGKEDYSSFVTLNDDVMCDNIDFLLMCWQELGRKDLLRPVRKAMDLAARLQLPEPLAGWADQYFAKSLQPAHARSYEPRSVNTGTTPRMIRIMMDYYRITGDEKFLKGVPKAIDFLRSQALCDSVASRWERPSRDPKSILVPRFLNPEDGKPLYVHRHGSNVGNGHYFTSDDIAGTIGHYSSAVYVNPDALQKEYDRLVAMGKDEATAESPLLHPSENKAMPRYVCFSPAAMAGGPRHDRDHRSQTAQDVMRMMQPNGCWLTPLTSTSNVYKPLPEGLDKNNDTRYARTMVGDEYDTSPYHLEHRVMGISTREYIRCMCLLMSELTPAP